MLRPIQELGYSYEYFHIDPQYYSYTFYTSDDYTNVKEWISHWELIGVQRDSQTFAISILLTNIDREQLDWQEVILPQNTSSFFSFTPDGMEELLDFLTTLLSSTPSLVHTSLSYFKLLNEEEEQYYKLQGKGGRDQKLYRYVPPISDSEIISIVSFPYWRSEYGRNERDPL